MQVTLVKFLGTIEKKPEHQLQKELMRILNRAIGSVPFKIMTTPLKEYPYSPREMLQEVTVKLHFYPDRLFRGDEWASATLSVTLGKKIRQNSEEYFAVLNTNWALRIKSPSYIVGSLQKVRNELIKAIREFLKELQDMSSKSFYDNLGRAVISVSTIRSSGGFDSEYILHTEGEEYINFARVSPLKIYQKTVPPEFEQKFNGTTLLVKINKDTYRNYKALEPVITLLQTMPHPHYHLKVTPKGGEISATYSFWDVDKMVHSQYAAGSLKFTANNGKATGEFWYYYQGTIRKMTLTIEDTHKKEIVEMLRKYNKGISLTAKELKKLRNLTIRTIEEARIELKKAHARPQLKKHGQELKLSLTKPNTGEKVVLRADLEDLSIRIFKEGEFTKGTYFDADWAPDLGALEPTARGLVQVLLNL